MEERASIIKLLGLPETFAVLLLTFSFILALAPYFSGADFGLFKIPQFTDSARKKLKVIGPLVFLALVMLFVPVVGQHAPEKPNPVNPDNNTNKQAAPDATPTKEESGRATPADVHAEVQQHIKRANELYNHADLEDAVGECDKALNLEPGNREARDLREEIEGVMKTLPPAR
ncbi:MAG TPA: hypothetical protein VNZ44_12695 [Pyrinomonadaceae bacterium]|nr:hypothetical protein [Pyrinomonadaceae bacterium]